MTQENKELLFKDLSARLPYGVKVKITSRESKNRIVYLTEDNICHLTSGWWSECKPYLFPLSSMTEEQRKELQELHFDYISDEIFNDTEFVYHYDCVYLIDWLNKNHIDYRGLIPLGLAKNAIGLGIYGK